MKFKNLFFLGCVLSLLGIKSAWAVTIYSTGVIPIKVSVTIQATTCDISNKTGGDTITVDLDTITQIGIERGKYNQEVPYQIKCSNNDAAVSLKLTGNGADFDNSLLQTTNNKDLGFQFKINDKKMPLGSTSSTFLIKNPPKLYVTPILNSKAKNLIGGDFESASAKLILQYE